LIETELRKIFKSGVTLPIDSRKKALSRLKDVIQRREDEIFSALKGDLGKCQFESKITETGFIISEINHALKNIDDWTNEVVGAPPLLAQPAKTRMIPSPKGTVLVLSPWNYPFQLALAPVVGAVAAGNCVVLKPSELAIQTGRLIESIVEEAFPDGQVKCVLGGPEIAQSLTKQAFDHYFFTGSSKVGRIIGLAALERFASMTLELGGKSPCIVDDSANMLHTTRRIAWGKALNAGQTCVAPDYLLAHHSIGDKLVEGIMAQWREFYGPDPKSSADYTRIINHQHFDRLDNLLKNTNGKIHGGQRDRNQRFFEPTIVTNIEVGDVLMQEEIFGPILPVLTWRNETDLADVIMQHPDPLAFYVFTERRDFSEKLLKDFSFGGACINHIALHLGCPDLPFGGRRSSGVGLYHGRFGFDTFSHFKGVVEASSLFDVRLKYPPYGKIDNLLKWFYM